MRSVIVLCLLLAPALARAADITDGYRTGLGGGSPSVPAFVQLCPSSDGSGTAVACATGAGGGIGTPTTPNVSAAQPVTYSAIPTTAIPPNTAVQEAASIPHGCDLANTGTVPLYLSQSGTATAASLPLAVGQSYHCPAPTTQALSVFNASTTTAGTLAGQVY